MSRRHPAALRIALAGLLAASGASAFAQLGEDPAPPPTDGMYVIKQVAVESSALAAENVESKILVNAAFTFDAVPGSPAKAAKHKRGRKGKKAPAEAAPKLAP